MLLRQERVDNRAGPFLIIMGSPETSYLQVLRQFDSKIVRLSIELRLCDEATDFNRALKLVCVDGVGTSQTV